MADINRPLVCDVGTGMMKVGFAGEDAPRAVFSSIVDVPHHKCVRVGMGQKETDVGDEVQSKRHALSLKYPIEHGVVKNWDGMEKIWLHTFDDELHVDPSEHPVLLSEPPLNPPADRETMAQLMFETFNIPAMYIALQPELSMYAAGRLDGIALHSGDGVSYAVPYISGAYFFPTITRVDVAGGDITDYMMTSLTKRGYDMADQREIVRDIKEKFSYVAFNYEQELERSSSATKEYTLPDGSSFAIGEERFCGPEVLFRPSLIGRECPGIHEMTYNTIRKCCAELFSVGACAKLFNNIILMGGSTMLSGFADRMEKEINILNRLEKKCTLTDLKKRIIATPERRWSVWIGGSMVASLGRFPQMCVSKTEYEECGPPILHEKCR
ncbi:hypothetical protein L6452_40211 [Arctium lappa]|uniref:Uncharacterized protein n=1 Tax=Arctium lappa TaxID=4217 RepID=A0ACB8XKR8_ARCLA|nr:hypothetical protein L6452_40211 [Arctium lappa]